MTESTAVATQNQHAFLAMDQAESMELFDAMLAGQAEIATYVYCFPVGGQNVYGLSLPGCTASLRNKCSQRVENGLTPYRFEFTTTEDRYDKDRDAWLCEVQIIDRTTGMPGVGRVYVDKFFDQNTDKKKPNKFYDRIAFSKAKRNAIRDFLDEEFIKMMIQLFIKQGKSKKIDVEKDRSKRVDGLISKTKYKKLPAGKPPQRAQQAAQPKPEALPKDTPATDEQIERQCEIETLFRDNGIDNDKGYIALSKHVGHDVGSFNVTEKDIEAARSLIENKKEQGTVL